MTEVTDAATGGDASDRFTFFCGGGCWFWVWFCASDGKMDDSNRSEPAASHRMSMPFCSVMVSRTRRRCSGGAKDGEEDRKPRVPGGGGGPVSGCTVVLLCCLVEV